MIIRPYQYHYFSEVNRLLQMRNLSSVAGNTLPTIGFVMFENDNYASNIIGAIFLRSCEGNVGIIDSLIVDPTLDASMRTEVIDPLVYEILKAAKDLEFTHVLAITDIPNVKHRAIKQGFRVVDKVILTKEV